MIENGPLPNAADAPKHVPHKRHAQTNSESIRLHFFIPVILLISDFQKETDCRSRTRQSGSICNYLMIASIHAKDRMYGIHCHQIRLQDTTRGAHMDIVAVPH